VNSLKRRLARRTGRPLYRAENVPSIKASIAKYEKGVCRRRAPATIIFWASLINREFAAALILSIANIVTMILAIETLDCRVTFRDIAHRNESKAARLAGLVPNGSKSSLSVRSVHFKA
jgi:hypothetical protein